MRDVGRLGQSHVRVEAHDLLETPFLLVLLLLLLITRHQLIVDIGATTLTIISHLTGDVRDLTIFGFSRTHDRFEETHAIRCWIAHRWLVAHYSGAVARMRRLALLLPRRGGYQVAQIVETAAKLEVDDIVDQVLRDTVQTLLVNFRWLDVR